jgi:hypothetical protein
MQRLDPISERDIEVNANPPPTGEAIMRLV